MVIHCDVALQCNATPDQLRAVGAALWRWSLGAGVSPARCLDDQVLADLIDGKLPAAGLLSRGAQRPGVRLQVRDEVSRDRRAAIAGLRRELPADAVEDVVVDGVSWNRRDDGHQPALGLSQAPVASPRFGRKCEDDDE